MADLSGLSDGALAVFAFAAYHELSSGQRVLSMVREDGAGHRANAAAVDELDERGLIRADRDELVFTPERPEFQRNSPPDPKGPLPCNCPICALGKFHRHLAGRLGFPLWHCRAHVPSLPSID